MADSVMNAYMALIPKIDGGAVKDIETDVAGAGDRASARFKAALSNAGVMAARAIATALTGLGKIASDAFSAYADFEQITGGVEQIFGEGSEATAMIRKFADEAYATAGVSATAYMEQVTMFSASLLQSLDGDTVAAAAKADKAIRAMSDNANTFGTDLASIQAAFQGFAKGNYTMLDNLRLGYGGTQTEMERLLADAEAISGIHYDISSYADVIDAIEVIQTQMTITGKTASESASTIQGSMSAVKASWSNLLVGLADDESALGGLVETFIGNVVTFAQNALPRLTIIVESIGEMLPTMIEMVIGFLETDILPLFESLILTILNHIPDFVQAGVKLLVSIVQDLPGIIRTVIAVLPQIVDSLVNTLLDPGNIKLFIQAGIDLMLGLAEGILQAIPKLIASAVSGLKKLVNAILEYLGIKSPSRVFAEIGDYCMQGLGVGFEDGTDEAVQAAQDAVSAVTDAAQAQINIGTSAGITGASAGNSGGIIINTVNIQADSTTTAEEIFGKIRMAAAMA